MGSALAPMVEKNGKLQVSIDPKPLNDALKWQHLQLLVLEDLLPVLTDSKVFSTLDIRDGFWHLKMDELSTPNSCKIY